MRVKIPRVKKLILIDGHAIIHRAFHAIQPLNTSSGELVNAVFGFTSMLLNVLEIEKPDYLAVTFDKKGATFRHHADETYKATRSKCPEELVMQIKRVYEIVRSFNFPIFAQAGFEADDMLGSIVERVKDEEDLHIIIVSGDRDLLQLVNEKVSLHDLNGGYRKSMQFTPAEVEAKYGLPAKLIPDYKGLVGDSSDNIAGVMGIGPKNASELLQKYGSLEGIYENIEEIKPTTREKLIAGKDSAFHSRMLATIRRDAQFDWDLPACKLSDFDREEVTQLFMELEFHSLLKRFEKLFPKLQEIIHPKPTQTTLF